MGKISDKYIHENNLELYHITSGAEKTSVVTYEDMLKLINMGLYKNNKYKEIFSYDSDIKSTVEKLKKYNFSAVIPITEIPVYFADELSHRLGTPGNDYKRKHSSRDKFIMQHTIKEHGLRCIKSKICYNFEQMKECYREWGNSKVVLKPICSAGTEGVKICSNENQTENYSNIYLGEKIFMVITLIKF